MSGLVDWVCIDDESDSESNAKDNLKKLLQCDFPQPCQKLVKVKAGEVMTNAAVFQHLQMEADDRSSKKRKEIDRKDWEMCVCVYIYIYIYIPFYKKNVVFIKCFLFDLSPPIL